MDSTKDSAKHAVMLLASKKIKVALATTHIPLAHLRIHMRSGTMDAGSPGEGPDTTTCTGGWVNPTNELERG